MWPHCCQAWHAIGKTMSQQAVARSREKDNENKKEIRASLKGHCHGLRDLLELQERSAAAWVAPGSQNSPNPSLQLPGATQAAADLSCSSNKSLRPWQRLFMDVQGCRLPALKTPQALPCSSQAPLRPRQTFPAALTSPWGRGSVFLWTFKAAVCQPSKLPKPFPAAPRRHLGRGRPFLQL